MKSKKVLYNLIAIQILFWFGWQFATYQIVYLQSVGMTSSEIGVMSAISSLVSMVASILWGWIADKTNSIKKAFMLDIVITAVFIVALPLLPTNFKYASVMFIVFRALTCIGQGPIGTLIDNHAVRNCEQYGLSFGTVSAFRCISGALGGFVCTLVLSVIEVKNAFWIFGVFMIPTLFCIFLSNDPKSVPKRDGGEKKRDGLGLIFKNRAFLAFIIFTMLFNLAHQAVTVFIPSFMDDIGVDGANWGLYNSVRTLTSIPFMFMFSKIRKRMSLRSILILACVFMGAESLLLGIFAKNLMHLLICGAIYGIGGGLYIGAVPLYILELAPENLKASSHNLYGAVCLGAGIVGNLFGGAAYGALGGSIFYIALGATMLMAVVFFAVSFMLVQKSRRENEADAV